ncbi:effector binding domain-containing protein [Paenibacillus typhae]|uniref:effector binding domain-containing protein n=1 Tax=Paenibacillus typhae TaxID=1174501 RepID=UPI001C8E5B3C|nr:effector binding domain-containing protein [Paenibacillus typhae]MBY0009173.1 effector binding domain-containing protein [Paenibacillus typhae]
MNLQTITAVTRSFNVSTRTLRYYEQIGLLTSVRRDGYAYRTYDEESLRRLEQILLLRKLRIPLKDIQAILQSEDARAAISVFQDKVKALTQEITALSTIRAVLDELLEALKGSAEAAIGLQLLADKSVLQIIESLPSAKFSLKEETGMSDLNAAGDQLSQLKDVRIVYLPPATVASIHCVGGSPEADTGTELRRFMIRTDLARLKPDLRHYGFNHPNGEKPDGSDHGYERWVTIPADLELPEPFVKKEFTGGLYAAHMIPMGNFEEWGWLYKWVKSHGEYELNPGDPACMGGLLEEHLNYLNRYLLSNEELDQCMQLDLLVPVKPKVNAS